MPEVEKTDIAAELGRLAREFRQGQFASAYEADILAHAKAEIERLRAERDALIRAAVNPYTRPRREGPEGEWETAFSWRLGWMSDLGFRTAAEAHAAVRKAAGISNDGGPTP